MSFLALGNVTISTADDLFPLDVLRHLIVLASWVLHDEAVYKAVTRESLPA